MFSYGCDTDRKQKSVYRKSFEMFNFFTVYLVMTSTSVYYSTFGGPYRQFGLWLVLNKDKDRVLTTLIIITKPSLG